MEETDDLETMLSFSKNIKDQDGIPKFQNDNLHALFENIPPDYFSRSIEEIAKIMIPQERLK